AALGLGPEPLVRAGARVLEGLRGGHRAPAGPPAGVPEHTLAVHALLPLGETGEVAAPACPRVLLVGAGGANKPTAGPQHPRGGSSRWVRLATIIYSPCSVHLLFTRTTDQEPSWVPRGVRVAQGRARSPHDGAGITRCDEQVTLPPFVATITHLPIMRCQIC